MSVPSRLHSPVETGRPSWDGVGAGAVPSEASFIQHVQLSATVSRMSASPSQACLQAEEHHQEGAVASGCPLRAQESLSLSCLFPSLCIPQDRMWPWRWTSLPNIPKNYECPVKWQVDIGFEPECWDLCPSARAKVALRATLQA